jgi:hypothetical protein
MTIFNTTLIISSIPFLILINDDINNGIISAQNDNYGISYGNNYFAYNDKMNVLQVMQNKSLIGKFMQIDINLYKYVAITLYNKNNKTNVIAQLNLDRDFQHDTNLYLVNSIFTEIRQQKMLRKIYRLSSKVNLFKKRLDRLTNKTL